MSLRFRRGGTGTGAPAQTVYGPTNGSQSVRDGTQPVEVAAFSGTPNVNFTQLNPNNSQTTNQAAITADTTGKVFFPKGLYQCSPAYTFKANTEYRWESVLGYARTSTDSAVMNGPGNAAGSFDACSVPAGSTFKGGKWQNFTSGLTVTAAGAVLEDVIITAMWNVGAALGGSTRASRCYIFETGSQGLNTAGTAVSPISNVTIDHCRIQGNGTRRPNGDAGAGKFLWTRGMTFEYNWYQDNLSVGVWWDSGCNNVLAQENVIEDNEGGGFFYEQCQGGTTFQHNAFFRNGDTLPKDGGHGGAIVWSSCDGGNSPSLGVAGTFPFILAEKNTYDGDGTQTAFWMHNGHSAQGRLCDHIYVNDNEMFLRTTSTAQVGGSNGASEFTGKDLQWNANKYHVTDLATSKWHWNTLQTQAKSWATWQGLGFDTDASGATRVVI